MCYVKNVGSRFIDFDMHQHFTAWPPSFFVFDHPGVCINYDHILRQERLSVYARWCNDDLSGLSVPGREITGFMFAHSFFLRDPANPYHFFLQFFQHVCILLSHYKVL